MHTYELKDYIVDLENYKIFMKKTKQVVQCSQEVAEYLCQAHWSEQYNRRKHKDVLSLEHLVYHDGSGTSIADSIAAKDNTEKEVIRNQIMLEIDEMIDTLPEKLQVVYRAYFVDGEKCIEIAKMMGCTNDTVTHRKNKLAEKLHKFAEQQDYEIEDFERDQKQYIIFCIRTKKRQI